VLHAILLEECGEGIQVERAGGMEWACGYDVSSEPRFPVLNSRPSAKRRRPPVGGPISVQSQQDSVKG